MSICNLKNLQYSYLHEYRNSLIGYFTWIFINEAELFFKGIVFILFSEVDIGAGEMVHVAVVHNVPGIPGVIAHLDPAHAQPTWGQGTPSNR